MKAGIISLVLAYMFSQFYRAFLAVLTPALKADIGATPEDLANASGIWFLVFAAMQIPVGSALDRFGPRRTATYLFALGGAGGAAVFAAAQTTTHINFAMALIGIGCSPVLMSSYFIFARQYPTAVFATMAGMTLGLGSLGNVISSAPLALAVDAFGWRGTMFGLAVLNFAVALLVYATVKDPRRVVSATKGTVLSLLAMPALWPVFVMMLVNYAPAAGIRGAWAGGYLGDVFGADAATIGAVTLTMGLAMIVGNIAYGPMDRLFGTRKWVIFFGNLIGAIACLTLYAIPDRGIVTATVLLGIIGLAGASFPMLVAHAKAFFPTHLTGRGVSLINLFGIGGVGLAQFITRPIFANAKASTIGTSDPYAAIFLFFGVSLLCGLTVYLLAKDRTD